LVTAFTLTPLKLLITPNAVIIGQCKRYALENFFALKVHETENRSGVMIFVSLNERRIDIIADKGIDDKVNPDEWQNTLNALIEKIKSNEVERGFIDAITSTGALLESHFPAKKKNINERPNHLIELKKSCYIR
jgi:putative membrane protein